MHYPPQNNDRRNPDTRPKHIPGIRRRFDLYGDFLDCLMEGVEKYKNRLLSDIEYREGAWKNR